MSERLSDPPLPAGTPPGDALRLDTRSHCRLAIGGYPAFTYDASGGGGIGRLGPPDREGRRQLWFDPKTLRIPPLQSSTTRWLGLPLPHGLQIRIVPQRLEGWLQQPSGALQLSFEAHFQFSALRWLHPPALQVRCELSSGACRSRRHQPLGQPCSATGEVELVGVALVPPSGAAWLDRFLGLPDEALALLRCRLSPCISPGELTDPEGQP